MALSFFLLTKVFVFVVSVALWLKFDIGLNDSNNDVGNSIESKPTNEQDQPNHNWLLSSDPGGAHFQIPPAKEGQFTVLGSLLSDIKDNVISNLNSPLFNKESDLEHKDKLNVLQDLGSLVNSAFGNKLTSNNVSKPVPAPIESNSQNENVIKDPTVSGDNFDETSSSNTPISRQQSLPSPDGAGENLIKNKPVSSPALPAINIPGLGSLFKAPSVPESDAKLPLAASPSKPLVELPNFGTLMRRKIPQL